MIIMKFGGSALQTAKKIRDVAAIVRNHLDQHPVLVLSAMGSTTDDLIAAGHSAVQQQNGLFSIEKFHREVLDQLELPGILDPLFCELTSLIQRISLHKELTSQMYDELLSFGERFSVRVFSSYLNKEGIPSSHFDAWDIGIVTSSDYTRAEILPETYGRVPLAFQNMKGIVPVITGFIAKDRAGSVTTLGRSGSDLTASVIGNAIMANEVQLWKDVNGILTADPRLASDAKSISHLSFFEASELARYGAKVLHPASVLPAMSKKIPVRIKNYQYPDHPGTLIKSHQPQRDGMVVAIAHKSHQSLIRITSHQGVGQFEFFTSVPQVFSELKLPAEITAATYNSILLMIGEHHCSSSLQKSLQHIGTVTIEHSKSNVSLIGTNERSSKFIETVIHALNSEGIEAQMISYGVSNVNTSLIVNDDEVKRCVEIIHRYFF